MVIVGSAAAAPPSTAADARRSLQPVRLAARLSVVTAVAAIGVGLAVPSVFGRHQLVVLVVGFLLGLPHGAVDHLVPFWTGWVKRSVITWAVVLLGYVSAAALTWAGLYWAGSVVLPVLLVVSVLHFGAGDLMADRDEQVAGFSSMPVMIAGVLARGGPVVAGPLLFWPDQAAQALSTLQLDFSMPSPWARLLLAVVVAGCVLGSAAVGLRTGNRWSALEVVVLAVVFVVLPPLAAFGIYFGAWHALRHTARLVVRDPRNAADLAVDRLFRPVRRFLASAALPTLVAAGSAAALVVTAGRHTDLTGTLFTVLLALTVPHLVVVAALDLTGLRLPQPPSYP